MTQLTKSDFIQYLNCSKSLWLKNRRPECYPEGTFTAFRRKLARDGCAVEAEVRRFFAARGETERLAFQRELTSPDGLYARADVVVSRDDGTLDLCEIKSSTRIKERAPDFQVKDATFQTIAAERCGVSFNRIFLVHLNRDYVRSGAIDPEALLIFADITERVAQIRAETEREIAAAANLLSQEVIDESACSCLGLGRSRHCDSFYYFNSMIPVPSIYDLPRISQAKHFHTFVAEGRLSLDAIDPSELSASQQLVLRAHQSGAPVIDSAVIERFFGELKYPLHFLDYEAFASAIPMIDRACPHAQIPFQYSLHVLDEEGTLTHHEYLAEKIEMPEELLAALSEDVGPTGSVISWHKSYEATRNTEMARLFPEYEGFLEELNARTVDLEDVFKTGYVDIAFRGSTSIKKILPVLVPDMTYEGLEIADGTAAMEGWLEMATMPAGGDRDARREALLAYCKQDTLAMVRLFEKLKAI